MNPSQTPCELLAENTFEALRIVRVGDWVFKFLRPHDSFPGQTAEERRRQILLRVRESHRHAELNPLLYHEQANCLVSQFIAGRTASTREFQEFAAWLRRTKRSYLADIGPENLRVVPDATTIAIDFTVDCRHSDWHLTNVQ